MAVDCQKEEAKMRVRAAQVLVTVPDSSTEISGASTSPISSGDESQTAPEKMPRHPPPSKPFPFKRPEIDLSAMLSVDQMKQLQVLIMNIMDELQTQVRDNFDKMIIIPVEPTDGITAPRAMVLSVPNPGSEKYRSQYGNIGIPVDNPDFEDRELLLHIMKSHPTNLSTAKPVLTIPTSPLEATASSKKTETELAIASLTELKRDALGHFGKWRGFVYKRLQEVVIKNGGTNGNVVRQGSQQALGNARRVGFTARGSSARLAVPLLAGEASNAKHIELYPPMYTALCNLPKEKRALILHTMLLMLLGLDQYSTYSRITLLKLATSLQVPTFVLLQDEYRVSQALAQIIKGISAEEVAQKRAEEGKPAKRWRFNGSHTPSLSENAAVLAEPLVAAGIGTVFGGIGLSTSVTATLLGGVGAADGTVPVGTLFGLYGARQGGKTMDAYAKDIQDFALIPIHGYGSSQTELLDPKDVLAEDRRMRVTIGISGWTTEENDFQYPWKIFGKSNEVYALRWELEALSKFGAALQTVMRSTAWSVARKEAAQQNVFASLTTSHWPETLIKASKVMDNPWTIAMVRAEKTGLVLAEILTNKVQGERTVSLIGYGLGARVIYACLTSLSEKRAFGIVENVVLFGAPCPSEIRVWTAMKSVVAGRLVNVYSKKDYLLGFLYRTCAWNFGIAGLQPIDGVPRMENVDLSDRVDNYLQYQYYIGDVLQYLCWEDVDLTEINKELPMRSPLKLSGGNFTLGHGSGARPELGEQNGNIMKESRFEPNQKHKAFTKPVGGRGEPKDRFMAKQPDTKAKHALQSDSHQAYASMDYETPKPRHQQGRADHRRRVTTQRYEPH